MASHGERGLSLLEVTIALAVSGLLAFGSVTAARSSAAALRLQASKRTTVSALLAARRLAYLEQGAVDLRIGEAASGLFVQRPGERHASETWKLDAGVTVGRAPARGRVRFHPSGLAENATVELLGEGGAKLSVIVNQRGLVR